MKAGLLGAIQSYDKLGLAKETPVYESQKAARLCLFWKLILHTKKNARSKM